MRPANFGYWVTIEYRFHFGYDSICWHPDNKPDAKKVISPSKCREENFLLILELETSFVIKDS